MRHSIFCQHLLNHLFKNHLCPIQDEYFPWFAGCQENIANQLKIHKMTFFENILGTYLIYQLCNETVDHCLTSSF